MVLGIADSVIGVAGKVLDKFVEDKDLDRDWETDQYDNLVFYIY